MSIELERYSAVNNCLKDNIRLVDWLIGKMIAGHWLKQEYANVVEVQDATQMVHENAECEWKSMVPTRTFQT